VSQRPHLSEWRRIGNTIDAARKPEPVRAVKQWPFYAAKELQRHLAGFPDTDIFYSEEHLF
jgi:hypothetical protein